MQEINKKIVKRKTNREIHTRTVPSPEIVVVVSIVVVGFVLGLFRLGFFKTRFARLSYT